MITNLFQSIGILFTILICAAVALVSMYISYILGIGVVIFALLFIIYHALSAMKGRK